MSGFTFNPPQPPSAFRFDFSSGGGAGQPAPGLAAPNNQSQGGLSGAPAQPTDTATLQPQPPKQWASDAQKQAIEQKIKASVNHLVEQVGGKLLPGSEVCPLLDDIGVAVTTIENGREWLAHLLAGDTGENLTKVLGALERGAIKESMHDFYIPRFLQAMNMTWEEFQRWVKESEETAAFLMGFGRLRQLTIKLAYSFESFPGTNGKDENVQPPHSNLPPVNPNLLGANKNLFGAPQGTASFNQQHETRLPFDAFSSSNMNRSSLPTASAPGSSFGNIQGGQHNDGATRSEVQGDSMHLDTPTRGHSAVPPAGGGGEYASVPNTTAPPAVVATTEDLSVASNVTHSTAGEDSASVATAHSAKTTKTAPVFRTSAANTGPVGSSASLPGVKTPATNAKPGGRKKKKATFSLLTPQHGLTRPSTDGNATHLRDNRSKNQNLLNTPGRLEAKEHVRNASVGQTLLEEVFDELDADKMIALIVALEKASTSHLIELKDVYPDGLKDLSKKDLLKNLISRIRTEKDFWWKLKIELTNLKSHPGIKFFLAEMKAEKDKVREEQTRVAKVKKQISTSAGHGTSETNKAIAQNEYEAEQEKQVLQRQIDEMKLRLAAIDATTKEKNDLLRFNSGSNQEGVNEKLADLQEVNDDLKSENVSRLALPLALERNDDAALSILFREINLVETSEEDVEKLEHDKNALFEQLDLIENDDIEALEAQAMDILYP